MGDDIVAVVAVGREGVVWWGRKKGCSLRCCLSFSSYGIPTERGVPTSLLALSRFFSGLALRSYVRLTMRDATTPDVCAFFLSSPLLPLLELRVLKPGEAGCTAYRKGGERHDAPGGTTGGGAPTLSL